MQFVGAVALIAAYLSDRYRARAIPVAVLSTIATVGYGVYYC